MSAVDIDDKASEGQWPETDLESLTTGDSLSDRTFDLSHTEEEVGYRPARTEAPPQLVSRAGIDILRRRKHGTEVCCGVKTVCYGTWKGKPACLAVFRFEFHTARSGRRFKNASVKINVRPNTHNERVQRSVHFFRNASKVGELAFTIERVFELTAFFGGAARTSQGVHDSEIKAPLISTDIVSRPERENKADGGIAWTVAESWLWKLGIPKVVETAVVVMLDESKQATIEIEINTDSTNELDISFPWSIPNALVFSPEIAIGDIPSTLKFEDLDRLEDWNKLLSTENRGLLNCPRRDRIVSAMIGFPR